MRLCSAVWGTGVAEQGGGELCSSYAAVKRRGTSMVCSHPLTRVPPHTVHAEEQQLCQRDKCHAHHIALIAHVHTHACARTATCFCAALSFSCSS